MIGALRGQVLGFHILKRDAIFANGQENHKSQVQQKSFIVGRNSLMLLRSYSIARNGGFVQCGATKNHYQKLQPCWKSVNLFYIPTYMSWSKRMQWIPVPWDCKGHPRTANGWGISSGLGLDVVTWVTGNSSRWVVEQKYVELQNLRTVCLEYLSKSEGVWGF